MNISKLRKLVLNLFKLWFKFDDAPGTRTLNLLTLVPFRGLRDINQHVYCIVQRLLCLHSAQKIVKTVYCVYYFHPVSSQLHPNCTRIGKGDSINFLILMKNSYFLARKNSPDRIVSINIAPKITKPVIALIM